MDNTKRRRGDRRDGRWLREEDGEKRGLEIHGRADLEKREIKRSIYRWNI